VTVDAKMDDELDPSLEKLMEELEGEGAPLPAGELDAMFRDMEGQVKQAESRPTWWFRSRSTRARRAMALGAFLVVVGVSALFTPTSGMAGRPMMPVNVAALAFLVIASLFVAIRPIHVPALPRWQAHALVALSLLATIVIAMASGEPTELPGTLWEHASPCMYFGLFMGIPVFAVARLLDRGTMLGPILAAAAAGLVGNVALQLHCPIANPPHTMAGHVSVAVLFVTAIALTEVVLRRRPAR
jgi:hypothetical protein